MYCKTKLSVHNYTVHNQVNNNVIRFLGDEINEGLESSIFATIISKHFYCEVKKTYTFEEITIFSNGIVY